MAQEGRHRSDSEPETVQSSTLVGSDPSDRSSINSYGAPSFGSSSFISEDSSVRRTHIPNYDSNSLTSAPSLAGDSVVTADTQDSEQLWNGYQRIQLEVRQGESNSVASVDTASTASTTKCSRRWSECMESEDKKRKEKEKEVRKARKRQQGTSTQFGLYLFGALSIEAGSNDSFPKFTKQGAFDIDKGVLEIPNEIYDVPIYFFSSGKFAFAAESEIALADEEKNLGIYMDRPLYPATASTRELLTVRTLTDAMRYKKPIASDGIHAPRIVKMDLPWKKISWIKVYPDLTVDVCKTKAALLRYSLRQTGVGMSTVRKNSHRLSEVDKLRHGHYGSPTVRSLTDATSELSLEK